MAKTREQVIQDQLGAMAFQLAILTADLDALREENAHLKGKVADNETSRKTVDEGPQ